MTSLGGGGGEVGEDGEGGGERLLKISLCLKHFVLRPPFILTAPDLIIFYTGVVH